MARVIVACPHCKARFDVSSFKPGSKIRCGSCYKILVIPGRSGGTSAPPAPVPKKKRAAPVPAKSRRGERAPARNKARPAPQAKQGASPAVVKEKTPPPEPVVEEPPAAPPAPPKEPAAVPKKEPTPPPKEPAPAKSGDPLIGNRINGEFEIVKKLGQGGYGTVYEAVDMSLKRRVAVKLMLREKTTNKEFVAKFLREARTAAQLSHPNIVKIHLVGFSKDLQQHFLAMEYVEGRTLSDIMADQGAFSVEQAIDVVVQASNGLAEAHRKNIIHRDIKPGNVMITPKGVVKVTDFGLAKIYDPDDAASMVIGTPYFMPPEQFEGKARDGRTDIYALGVTFYFLLTLKRPFDGKTPAQVLLNVMQNDPASPREYNPDIPERLCAIISKMIARKLDDRYSTCEELLRDLKACQSDTGEEEAVFCPGCGFANPFTTTKCQECGNSLLDPCPKCGTPDSIAAKFCGNCGANLEQERQIAAMLAEAESHEAAGRLEDALAKYQEAQQAAPENSQVVEAVRRAEQLRGERDELVESLGRLIDEGKFMEALPRAEEAAEKFPDRKEFTKIVARARDGAKEERLAEALAEVRSLGEAGDLGGAVDAARRAIEINPENDEAKRVLKEAELAVEKHALARDRASGLEEAGHLTEAMAAWREALEIMPGDDTAETALGRIAGVMDQAGTLRDQAVQALERRDLPGARKALEEAVELLPTDPKTLEAIGRLRERELSLHEEFAGALGRVAKGDLKAGIEELERLTGEHPDSERYRTAGENVRLLAETARYFRSEGEAALAEGSRELAGTLAEIADRLTPGQEDVAALRAKIEESGREREALLGRVRGLLKASEPAKAYAELGAAGGVVSRDAEVAELAREAASAMVKAQEGSHEKQDEVLREALATARSLLEVGNYHASLSACQKALRIDRHNEQARKLKSDIDRALETIENAGSDSRIETGFFNIADLEEELRG